MTPVIKGSRCLVRFYVNRISYVSCCFLPLFYAKLFHEWYAGGWWHKVCSITCTTRCHTCHWMKFLHLHSALVTPWSVWPSLSLQSSFSTHKSGQSMLSVLPLQFLELSYILRWVYCFCVKTINSLEMYSSSDSKRGACVSEKRKLHHLKSEILMCKWNHAQRY